MTSCHANPYTNEANQGASGNRTLATTFTASDASTTPEAPSSRLAATQRGARLANHTAEEAGLEPAPPHRAAAFSKRVRRTHIRLSSKVMPPPGLEPGLQASQARVVIHSTTGTHSSFTTSSFVIPKAISPPGLEPGTQRSKRRMIVHFTTGMLCSSGFLKRVASPKAASLTQTTLARTEIASQSSFVALRSQTTVENQTNKKPRRPSGLRGLLSVIGPLSSSSPGCAPIAIKRITARNLHARLLMAGT